MMKYSLFLAVFVAACGEYGDGSFVPDQPDAGLFVRGGNFNEDAGTAQRLELGTGFSAFRPVSEGQMLELSRGPQGGGRWGGYHIWHAAKINGFHPKEAELIFRTYLAENEELIGTSTRTYDLEYVEGSYIVTGGAPPIRDCCLAANREVIMHVEIRDREGKSAIDRRRVVAGSCLDGAGGASVCQ